MPVHPRLRGELGSKERQSPRPGGSSPLTRGTQSQLDENGRIRRFIPAYAGNSVFGVLLSRGQPVHPRLRGELDCTVMSGSWTYGSSPLTRGTLPNKWTLKNLHRFIPAYAGNSSLILTLISSKTVHPRLRGELEKEFIKPANHCGSSPLTRGTPQLAVITAAWVRFIPAYAGNSPNRSRFIFFSSVHPRLRGELDGNRGTQRFKDGSSPLTRGTRRRSHSD